LFGYIQQEVPKLTGPLSAKQTPVMIEPK
jgi:hypothetical protein